MHEAEISQIINTTARRYLKGAEDLTLRDRKIWRELKNRGNIEMNLDGTEIRHQVKFALPEVEAYTGGVIDFEPSDKFRQLVLDWKGYLTTDAMTEQERQKNKGRSALINRYKSTMKDMRQALEDQFGTELYNDGGTNTSRIDGLETFMGGAGSCLAADKIEAPSDTYGGKSTAPGAEAGTWSSDLSTMPSTVQLAKDWPSGNGTPEYDYLSPRLLNWASTAWTGNTDWLSNCERVIRQAIIWTRLTTGRTGHPDMLLLAEDLFFDYQNAQEPKFRVSVPHKMGDDLGFDGQGLRQEGIYITTEFGMTASVGYILNFDKMGLRVLTPQLWVPRGPEFDINTRSFKFLMCFDGNLVFQPKFFSKLADFTA